MRSASIIAMIRMFICRLFRFLRMGASCKENIQAKELPEMPDAAATLPDMEKPRSNEAAVGIPDMPGQYTTEVAALQRGAADAGLRRGDPAVEGMLSAGRDLERRHGRPGKPADVISDEEPLPPQASQSVFREASDLPLDTAQEDPVAPIAYTNRELAWLAFNRRVMREADNPDNPLMERLFFLSITASNLDEFFMVRYASLRHKMLRSRTERDAAGLTPRQQVRLIDEDARKFMDEQIDLLHRVLLPEMAREGMRIWPLRLLNAEQLRWVESSFRKEALPCLSPFLWEGGVPFPQVAGRALQIGMLLRREDNRNRDAQMGPLIFATLQVPAGMRRLWSMPRALGEGYVLIEEIIARFAAQMVPGFTVLDCRPYRVTRDADYTVGYDITKNLVAETKKSVSKRKTGAIVRLEVDAGATNEFVRSLCEALRVRTDAVYRIAGPLALTFLGNELYKQTKNDALRYPPFSGRLPEALSADRGVFAALRGGDIFLHHPYDSFDAVMLFVREAAVDPRVLAINMTLYRVSSNSPVIRALCEAAEAGKRVTVLLELKARFDEENNIHWAEVLQRAGCEVLYGMPRLKTHSKITLVVRREEAGLARYMHLGTGNYNDVTARQYTDMGLLTCDEALGEDAQAFFNMITGFSKEPEMQRLIYAPRMLRVSLTALIEAEIAHAKAGRPCGIVAKMNSLVDPGIIRLLYEASAARVPIKLIVRGVCCLRAGVPGLSETIEVHSIIGRFLEHSRVFRFENDGKRRVYLSSADWMPRNLNRRIELMFPIVDANVRAQVCEVLDVQWRDNVKSWVMLPDGRYERVTREEPRVNAQEMLFSDGYILHPDRNIPD